MAFKRNVSNETKILGSRELRKKGVEVFRSTRPSKVREQNDDLILTTAEGDRLDNLAAQFYGSPRLWFVIASINNLNNGSMHIPPGTRIRIPVKARVV